MGILLVLLFSFGLAQDEPEEEDAEEEDDGEEEEEEEEEEEVVFELTLPSGQGTLKGVEFKNRLTMETCYAFLKIPYARPPIGDRRFKAPEEPLPWEGVWDSTSEGTTCPFFHPLFRSVEGNEDCLILNVYTPKRPDELVSSLRPVMVWIHGGGFHIGSGSLSFYGPDFLLADDVVVVTINYRLAVFGFTAADTPEVSGNAGLKDQVMALKWVQKNIRGFGGDPDSVTIFGESAGGASVHLHMLSPASTGLFHRAISQSGVAINPWVLTNNRRNVVDRLGWVFDCNTTQVDEILDCLRKVDYEDLTKSQYNVLNPNEKEMDTNIVYLPCVEPGTAKQPFLSDKPRTLLQAGPVNNVPYMVGTVSMETGIIARGFTEKMIPDKYRSPAIKALNRDIGILLPGDMTFNDTEQKTRVVERVRQFYFNNKTVSTDTMDEFVKLTTDLYFLLGTHETVNRHLEANSSQLYRYYLTLVSPYGFLRNLLSPPIQGPIHVDDVGYLFYVGMAPQNLDHTGPGYEAMKKIVSLWTNFSKHGNPTPDTALLGFSWTPSKLDNQVYLDIGEQFTMKENVEHDRMTFWDKLNKEEHFYN